VLAQPVDLLRAVDIHRGLGGWVKATGMARLMYFFSHQSFATLRKSDRLEAIPLSTKLVRSSPLMKASPSPVHLFRSPFSAASPSSSGVRIRREVLSSTLPRCDNPLGLGPRSVLLFGDSFL